MCIRDSSYPYQCITESVDVQQVANLEKKVPLDWITPDAVSYTHLALPADGSGRYR